MGFPIMFYARDDVREFLKSVKNRSELINQLLTEHINSNNKKAPEPVDVISVMDAAAAKEKKRLETDKLKQVILEEIEKQNNEPDVPLSEAELIAKEFE